MAEERLIDEDKDRKYKIRINEDGEEELILADPENDDGGEDLSDIPVFDIPVYEEDDEEAAVLTPEQLAERDRLKEQEEKSREEKLEALLEKARTGIEGNDFETALYASSKAEELAPFNGEVSCVKLQALTRNFTYWLALEESSKAADGVREYASDEQKTKLKSLSAELDKKIGQTEKTVAELNEENESKKAERRTVFAQNKNRAFVTFLFTVIPFTVLLIASIVISTYIFSDEKGSYLVATIVLGALTLIALVCAMFTANRYWSAVRNVKLNEKDTSTKLGRDYIKSKTELEYLKNIKRSFNDLS